MLSDYENFLHGASENGLDKWSEKNMVQSFQIVPDFFYIWGNIHTWNPPAVWNGQAKQELHHVGLLMACFNPKIWEPILTRANLVDDAQSRNRLRCSSVSGLRDKWARGHQRPLVSSRVRDTPRCCTNIFTQPLKTEIRIFTYAPGRQCVQGWSPGIRADAAIIGLK